MTGAFYTCRRIQVFLEYLDGWFDLIPQRQLKRESPASMCLKNDLLCLGSEASKFYSESTIRVEEWNGPQKNLSGREQ